MTKYNLHGSCQECTLIGSDKDGLAVMQDSTGVIFTVPYTSIEEVVPYTVGIKFNGRGTTYHYFAKEGDVSVGDLVIVNGGMGKITAVNTRSTKATKDLEGTVVVTKKIGD